VIDLFDGCLYFLICLFLFHPVVGKTAERIVSMNLCSDQMVLLLAKPESIVSVSFLAADSAESPVHHLAKNYHLNHGGAEEIFNLNPDLILVGPYTDNAAQSLLSRLGLNIFKITVPLTFDALMKQYIELGIVLNRQVKATKLVELLRSRLRGLAALGGDKKFGSIAIFYSNGSLLKSPSLAVEVLDALGLSAVTQNAFSLEDILRLRTNYIVKMVYRSDSTIRGASIFKHPVLSGYIDSQTMIEIPQAWFACSGPYLLDAIGNILGMASNNIEGVR
jgi:iron complex transport system substrate-binding protein